MKHIAAIMKADADGTLHLPLPVEWRNQAIRVNADLEPAGQAAPERGGSLHGFGCLRGQIVLAADFDAPLEDFQDYTE